jgi:hypothetical protein
MVARVGRPRAKEEGDGLLGRDSSRSTVAVLKVLLSHAPRVWGVEDR